MNLLGYCKKCGKWVVLQKNLTASTALPEHDDYEGNRCKNSGYSAEKIKYRVKSSKDAVTLAKMITNDIGVCLSSGCQHSLACGDGERCASERRRRSLALAEYVLEMIKSESERRQRLLGLAEDVLEMIKKSEDI